MKLWITIRVLLLALVVPAPAWAECAWVLWKETGHSGPGAAMWRKAGIDREIVHADPHHAVCERLRERLWRVDVEFVKERQIPGREELIWDDKTPGFYIHRIGPLESFWQKTVTYNCLPDTIDPRGPKGGGR